MKFITSIFFHSLFKIHHLLASRAEYKRIRGIREALQAYAIRRGISLNNKNN